jgi:regulator of RNase E activity RraA
LVAAFSALDTCAVSDALDSLGLPGTVDGVHEVWQAGRVVGQVVTMELAPVTEKTPPASRHLGVNAITAASPGDVVVVATGGRTDCASWGGLLSRAAVKAGVAAIAIDGALRDVDETRELGLPVFARGRTPRTARGRVAEVSMGQPVQFAGGTVRTGDLMIADGSGVVFVEAADAERVFERARSIAQREALMAGDVDAGITLADVLGTDYETMLDGTA